MSSIPPIGFNRTFMELKCLSGKRGHISRSCFNRTFMELKYGRSKELNNLFFSFNRTFMELKLRKAISSFRRLISF